MLVRVYSSAVEHGIADPAVAGSIPAAPFHVPVAQLDKASDYESEDWGFKSLQG